MKNITSGHVRYTRVKKDDDYGINRTAEVHLSFTVPEDGADDAHLLVAHSAAKDAHDLVHAMLAGMGASKPAPAPAAAAAPAGKTKAELAAEATAPKPAAKPRGPAKPPAAPAAATASAAEVVEDVTVQEPAKPAETSAADLTDDDLLTGADVPVTDEELTSQITRKNAEVKNPQAIRELIGKFNPNPGTAFQARQIDPKVRPQFLKELAALKPAS